MLISSSSCMTKSRRITSYLKVRFIPKFLNSTANSLSVTSSHNLTILQHLVIFYRCQRANKEISQVKACTWNSEFDASR